MNAMCAIFKRELKSYFATPVAYIFLVVFMALASYLTFQEMFFQANQASLQRLFMELPWLFALLAPAIAMRMWAEERRTGTVELLFTLPVTVPQAVLGKFLAGWVFFLIALALTSPIFFTICWLGDPEWGPVFSGYFGAALMAASYLAISCFFSAITRNQVISFILAVAVCFTFVFIGKPTVVMAMSDALPDGAANFLESLSFLSHYDTIQRGAVEFGDVFYLLLITGGFLMSCCLILDDRKAQ